MLGAQNKELLWPPKSGGKSAKSKMSFAHPTWSLLSQKTIRLCLKLGCPHDHQFAHGWPYAGDGPSVESPTWSRTHSYRSRSPGNPRCNCYSWLCSQRAHGLHPQTTGLDLPLEEWQGWMLGPRCAKGQCRPFRFLPKFVDFNQPNWNSQER